MSSPDGRLASPDGMGDPPPTPALTDFVCQISLGRKRESNNILTKLGFACALPNLQINVDRRFL